MPPQVVYRSSLESQQLPWERSQPTGTLVAEDSVWGLEEPCPHRAFLYLTSFAKQVKRGKESGLLVCEARSILCGCLSSVVK